DTVVRVPVDSAAQKSGAARAGELALRRGGGQGLVDGRDGESIALAELRHERACRARDPRRGACAFGQPDDELRGPPFLDYAVDVRPGDLVADLERRERRGGAGREVGRRYAETTKTEVECKHNVALATLRHAANLAGVHAWPA